MLQYHALSFPVIFRRYILKADLLGLWLLCYLHSIIRDEPRDPGAGAVLLMYSWVGYPGVSGALQFEELWFSVMVCLMQEEASLMRERELATLWG